MNKQDKAQLAEQLLATLTILFASYSYTICGGAHWRDRAKSPEQVADDSITVKLMPPAQNQPNDRAIVRLDYEVRSTQPSFVFADFNICRKGEQCAKYSVVDALLVFFGENQLVNSAVSFFPEPHLWFVIKHEGIFYHIYLHPKFGF